MQDGGTVLRSYFLPQIFLGAKQVREDTAPFLPLLWTVFNSIFEVFLLCSAGYLLAGRGILDKKTQKQLNHLNVTLFTPALLFSKVAFFLSPAKLRELWIVPIFFLLVTGTSMIVAYSLGSLFRLKKSQRSFGMAAAMFMNSNSLPIALMQSIVVTVPGLQWGDDDNKNAMLGRALTYLVLYSTLGMIVRWSYGVKLLSQADEEDFVPEVTVDDEAERQLLGSPDHIHFLSSSSLSSDADPINAPSYLRPPLIQRPNTTFYHSFPNSPNQTKARLPDTPAAESPLGTPSLFDGEESEDENEGIHINGRYTRELPVPVHAIATLLPPVPRGPIHPFARSLRRTWIKFNDFMTVPLWASLLSIIVACIPPLQHALEYHTPPLKGALKSAGNCSIPLTLVVLGAYFYPFPEEASKNANGARQEDRAVTSRQKKTPRMTPATSNETLAQSVKGFLGLRRLKNNDNEGRRREIPGETRTVAIAVVSRMILTPVLMMPFVIVAAKYDLHEVFDDPVFVVSNVLLMSSPPALTLAQITQAASGDAFERLISRTIFWSYCVVTPPATILYVMLGLVFARL